MMKFSKKTFAFGNRLRVLTLCGVFGIFFVPSLVLAATITVNSNGDARIATDGNCDLSEALDNANNDTDNSGGDCAAGSGADDIIFNVGGGDAQVITMTGLGSPLITSEVHIDGTTQPSSGAPASCSPRNLLISIDAGGTSKGFDFEGGSANSSVKGLNIYGSSVGAIVISTDDDITLVPGNITVTCNNIGTDLAGAALAPSVNADSGIRLEGTTTFNVIGGTGEAERNIVSGSSASGIWFLGPGVDNNIVQGNYIGTDVTGTFAIQNGANGLQLQDANNNTIGGSVAGQGNVISGNGLNGVFIGGPAGSDLNVLKGNYIGTDAAGLAAIPNFNSGVDLNKGSTNTFGTSVVSDRNIFSGNSGNGMSIQEGNNNIIQNNYFGLDVNGGALGNGLNGLGMSGAVGVLDSNQIGGNRLAGEGNIFSGNGANGMNTNNDSNTIIKGNIFGLDPTGNSKIPNIGSGLAPNTETFAIIGSATAGEGNIISGNNQDGLHFDFGGGVTIKGNIIGPDITGTINLGNGNDGMVLANQPNNFTIGGPAAGERNIISGNGGNGINMPEGDFNVIQGNYIGTDITGALAFPNSSNGINFGGGLGTRNNDVIGGNSLLGEGNVISASGQSGINGTGVNNLTIKGNIVGLTSDGLNALGNGGGGVNLDNSSLLTIGGALAGEGNVISANAQGGINLSGGTTASTIFGNYIGMDVTGINPLPNNAGGVHISDTTFITVGGPNPGQKNIISSNGTIPFGGTNVDIGGDAHDNTIQGNWIGLDAAGNSVPDVGFGFNIRGYDNLIGGPNPGEGNVISAHGTAGMVFDNGEHPGAPPFISGNKLQGNFIGTDSTGAVLPGYGNGGLGGVLLVFGAQDNLVGGTVAGEGNVIAGNSGEGVFILGIPTFGGTDPVRNAILGNSIHDNTGLGIEHAVDSDGNLAPDQHVGPDPNDPLDPDAGPNDYLNHPIIYNISPAGPGIVNVDYFLDVPANDYRVEFFSNTAADPSNHGEGETFLDFDPITHTGGGVKFFSKIITASPGDFITATATEDFGGGTYGSTSEFSPTTVVAGSGIDFGDAPDTAPGTTTGNYKTLAGDNGAYHVIDGVLYLGSCVDADLGDLQNANADADDTSTTTPVTGVCAVPGDDENGVSIAGPMTEGTSANITVTSSDAGKLDAWIDFNQDGDFDDASEQVLIEQSVVAGANPFALSIPNPVTAGTSYARFRLSPVGSPLVTPSDEVIGGEVEDYKVTLVDSGVPAPPPTPPSSGGGGSSGGSGGAVFHSASPVQPPAPPATQQTLACQERFENPFPFTDSVNHWAVKYIDFLYRHCVIDGKSPGIFAPDDAISRAEVTKIVLKLFNWGTSEFQNVFSDVFANDWFAKYVIQGFHTGLLVGYPQPDGTVKFMPNQPITRAEALKIILFVKGVETGGEETSFPDVQKSDWFYSYVAYAWNHGLIKGYVDPKGGPNFFAPNQPITRAEFSKIAVLAFQPDFNVANSLSPEVAGQVLGVTTTKADYTPLIVLIIFSLLVMSSAYYFSKKKS